MGKRGVHPKPTNLRILHGDQKSRINTDEPPAPPGAPELPDEVTSEVRQVWHHTVARLQEMGLLYTADRDTLLCYCEAVVAHRRASEILAEEGIMSRTASGSPCKHPASAVQNEAASQIHRYAQHFGLTPSARSEIRTGKAKGGDSDGRSADRFLTG